MPGNNQFEDVQPRLADNITDGVAQLHIHFEERLLHVMNGLSTGNYQVVAQAHIGSQFANLLAAWLKRCGIETVALESTGIYWISLYEVLELYGFEIRVVNARHVKHVPGRTKTDVLDCQWIQKLHSFGPLNGSFRPNGSLNGRVGGGGGGMAAESRWRGMPWDAPKELA